MLKMIAAVALNGVIGNNNELPWRLRSDLRWFKEKTMGHAVAMGSNTFRSILTQLKGPLPGRQNLVLTRRTADTDSHAYDGFDFVQWWETIVRRAQHEDVFVIGGGMFYDQMLPYSEELFLTRIQAEIQGDTFFPNWEEAEWARSYLSDTHPADRDNEYPFRFEIYRRISGLQKL